MWPWGILAPSGGSTWHKSRRRHLGPPLIGRPYQSSCTSTSSLCAQNEAAIQTSAGSACLLFKKSDTASALPASCFMSCYSICDSEPTKYSFQLRCPPHAISSWKNHIVHYRECISPAWLNPAPGKKHKHGVIWQFGRGQESTLNEISAANQHSFMTVFIWMGVKTLQCWGREGRKRTVFMDRWHTHDHIQPSQQHWEAAVFLNPHFADEQTEALRS